MKELSMEAMKKAIRYEETARQSKKKIVIEYIKELERGNRTGEESKWEKGRRETIERTELGEKRIREMKETKDEGKEDNAKK